jgi:hypothetical protein
LLCVAGSRVTLTQIRRGLTLGKGDAESLCNSLVESGHLEQSREVRAGNNRLTVEYIVRSTDPMGASKPAPFLAQLPTGAELDDELEPPPPGEYLGEDDFADD